MNPNIPNNRVMKKVIFQNNVTPSNVTIAAPLKPAKTPTNIHTIHIMMDEPIADTNRSHTVIFTLLIFIKSYNV